MIESEEKYLDAAEVAADLVELWSRLNVAAFRQKYGVRAGRDLQSQTDMLRLTLLELLDQSHRVVIRDAAITSVDGIDAELIAEVNEIEGVQKDEPTNRQ